MLDSAYNIKSKVQLVLTTPFKEIYKYNISKKGDYAIVVGKPDNKIHIYSLVDFQLKFCLDSEFQEHGILNISISKKTKFFCILYDDYDIEIYKLTDEKRVNQICQCMDEIIRDVDGHVVKKKKEGFLKKTLFTLKVNFDNFRIIFLSRVRKALPSINLTLKLMKVFFYRIYGDMITLTIANIL
jgi:hypothetical protein